MNNKLTVLKVPALEIVDAPSMAKATEVLSQANKYLDAVKAEEEKVTKPLNEALKAERARFAPFKKSAEAVISDIRTRMSVYMTAEAKRVKEEQDKIAARIGDGKGKLKMETAVRKFDQIEKPEEAVTTDSGMVKFRTDYDVVVTDIRQVPEEYLEVLTAKVKTAMKAGVKVPGLRLEEKQVAVNYR